MFPGGNILTDAFELIGTTDILYYKDIGREQNDQGIWVTSYADPVEVEASVQAPDRNTYVKFGLDFQKNYMNVFLPTDTVDLSRDKSGDQFEFGGKRYQLESEVPWFEYDGWVEVYVVQIGKVSK